MRGKHEKLSDNPPLEENTIFSPDSPKKVSFLNIVCQSTPKDAEKEEALQHRDTLRNRKEEGTQPILPM